MKIFAIASILAGAAASVFGQYIGIDIGAPVNGSTITQGENFTCQVILPQSDINCIQIGIAIAVNPCTNGVCPEPENVLGYVLYAGSWTPIAYPDNLVYQNFTLQIDEGLDIASGEAIFTLTHLCLLGLEAYPLLEFSNITVTIESTGTVAV